MIFLLTFCSAVKTALAFIKNTVAVVIELIFGARSTNNIAAKIITFVLLALLLGEIFFAGKSCYTNSKIEETRSEVGATKTITIESESKTEILIEQKKELETNANYIQQQSVQANGNYHDARNVDSGRRDGNFSAVRKRWCEDHRGDSKCR